MQVEFKNVSYSYYMQEGYTLKNLSFKIHKGERIALVGHNGAGKTTTIAKLANKIMKEEGKTVMVAAGDTGMRDSVYRQQIWISA